jgi:hypothetical protein
VVPTEAQRYENRSRTCDDLRVPSLSCQSSGEGARDLCGEWGIGLLGC